MIFFGGKLCDVVDIETYLQWGCTIMHAYIYVVYIETNNFVIFLLPCVYILITRSKTGANWREMVFLPLLTIGDGRIPNAHVGSPIGQTDRLYPFSPQRTLENVQFASFAKT